MSAEAAKLLDELMGRHRNLAPDEKPNLTNWESPEMCHYYLARLCPHDLFNNTKADLGACSGVHDDDVKLEFSQLPAYKRSSYEDEYIRFAQSLINEIERKIRKSRERLELRPDDKKLASLVPPQYSRHEEKITMLTDKINKLVEEAESLGCKGQVEEAQGIMKLCDNLRQERDDLRKVNEGSVWHQAAEIAASQEKQMDVCEICGSFLIIGDAQQRIDDHLSGKIHRGYAKLRESVEEIRKEREAERERLEQKRAERRREMDSERRGASSRTLDRHRRSPDRHRGGDERRRSRDRDHKSRGDYDRRDRDYKSRDRDRRSRDRDHKSRDKERRSRDRDHKSRDKGRRSRDRDHKSRDKDRRSRDRDHKSRDKDRRSRERDQKSRDRDRRSRSRDRDHKARDKDRRSRDKDRRSHERLAENGHHRRHRRSSDEESPAEKRRHNSSSHEQQEEERAAKKHATEHAGDYHQRSGGGDENGAGDGDCHN